MEKTKEFPVMVSDFLHTELLRAAKNFVGEFTSGVYPMLYKFGILDDEHILKYLFTRSRQDIYEDVLRDAPEVIKGLEQDALFEPDRDVWGIFRDYLSPVKSPLEDGFIFAKMPMSDYSKRNVICKSLSVKDKVISVNEEVLINACIIHPTEKQKKLFYLLSDFCEKFNDGGYNKEWVVNNLFVHSDKGVRPSIKIILGKYSISQKS